MLLLVQIDDRSGEVLGAALEELAALGARNVQLLSSQTKKGRPGRVLLLDLPDELEPEVAAYLGTELGAWGYHVLAAEHRHFDITYRERVVDMVCGDKRASFRLAVKHVLHQGRLLRVKIERDDVEALARFARASDVACSTDTVRALVEHELRSDPQADAVEVRVA